MNSGDLSRVEGCLFVQVRWGSKEVDEGRSIS